MELKPSSQLIRKSTTNHTYISILVLSLVLLATVELLKNKNAQGEWDHQNVSLRYCSLSSWRKRIICHIYHSLFDKKGCNKKIRLFQMVFILITNNKSNDAYRDLLLACCTLVFLSSAQEGDSRSFSKQVKSFLGVNEMSLQLSDFIILRILISNQETVMHVAHPSCFSERTCHGIWT